MSGIPEIEDFDDPTFDPFAFDDATRSHDGNIYVGARQLEQQKGPVQEGDARVLLGLDDPMPTSGIRNFVIFDPDLARDVLADADLYSQEAYAAHVRLTFGNAINQMNPPEHTRFRRVFQNAFLPHNVSTWSDKFVQPVIDELIGAFKDNHKVDLVSKFTHLYPFKVIFKQLCLPERDIKTFQKLAETLAQRTPDMKYPKEASRKLGVYLEALIEERRRNPGDDLVSAIVSAEADGDRLPDDIIVSFFRQLLNAAGDTTYRATGNLLVGLLRDRPDQYRMLVDDRSLISRAVEEGMRWDSPINAIHRMATRDVELGGVHIPAGSYVEVLYSSVGHDSDAHENPEQFDMMRPNQKKHFGFGYGPHVCIGQHLARLEMSRALNALVENFPNLRLDPEHPPPQVAGWGLRRPLALHVLLH